MDNLSSDISLRVKEKTKTIINEICSSDINIDTYLVRKLAMLTVIVEEQNTTIKQLTETINKIVDHA